MNRGRLDKAEGYFREALVNDVDYGPAHNNLGRLYYDQGNNYLAAWEFEYAIKVMPNHAEPLNNLGMVLERVGKIDEAIDSYERAYACSPDSPEVVGNLAKALWCRDKHDPRAREMLDHLVFVDSRCEWVNWAKEQIACGNLTATTASNKIEPPDTVPPPSPSPMKENRQREIMPAETLPSDVAIPLMSTPFQTVPSSEFVIPVMP